MHIFNHNPCYTNTTEDNIEQGLSCYGVLYLS